MENILFALIISIAIQLVMFLIAYSFKTDKLTDISYALTFALLGLIFFLRSNQNIVHIILLVLLFLWSARLGSYLLIRISKIGKDKRFDEMRQSFFRFLGFWVIQGFTVWIVLIPSFFLFEANPTLILVSYIGIIIWTLGFLTEYFADKQKFKFKNNLKNKDKFIQSGLWKYSRHPNYFGEFLMWVGIYVLAVSSLNLTKSLISLVSPLFILVMLLFVSGIPLLEKSYEKRYGKEWINYKSKTSKFILLPNKK